MKTSEKFLFIYQTIANNINSSQCMKLMTCIKEVEALEDRVKWVEKCRAITDKAYKELMGRIKK